MKKMIVLQIAASLLIFFAAAPSAQELKFTTQDFAPFSYTTDGQVAGPAVEIIQSVCAKMQTQCSFRLLPWLRAKKWVRFGHAHGMFVIGHNKKREEWLYFSHPLMMTEYGFFVRKDNPMQYVHSGSIDGYKVGVYGPSNTSNSLQMLQAEKNNFTIEIRPHDEPGFRKLSVGRVQAVYSNKDVGWHLIRKLGLKNIRYAGIHRKLPYYIGFGKEHIEKATVDRFNHCFAQLHQTGTIEKILVRYQMTPALLPSSVQPD